jgi:hypothetical protein
MRRFRLRIGGWQGRCFSYQIYRVPKVSDPDDYARAHNLNGIWFR